MLKALFLHPRDRALDVYGEGVLVCEGPLFKGVGDSAPFSLCLPYFEHRLTFDPQMDYPSP